MDPFQNSFRHSLPLEEIRVRAFDLEGQDWTPLAAEWCICYCGDRPSQIRIRLRHRGNGRPMALAFGDGVRGSTRREIRPALMCLHAQG